MTNKDTMPKHIWVDAKCFPTRNDEAGTYYIDGECQDVPCVKYTRLSPDDIVISRKELEGMKTKDANLNENSMGYAFNQAIDKILEMGDE